MVFLTFWAVGILFVVIGFHFHCKFLARLKNNHTQLYSDLGKPGVFTKYPISTKLIIRDLSPNNLATKYSEFMAKKQWEELSDSELNKYASYRRYTQYILGALFFVAIISAGTKL
ncbi:hypothetical protein SAMN03080615_03032 [Amphritea atlantica]|uniref:Uncharacterized protein n=1 Tax=Amphritea atlantica TaxID=355243 RepID=A0A1H9JHK7_9GAMM|nr:hypothetical protein SAMN03080615_03032 [Amphritea atlantica]